MARERVKQQGDEAIEVHPRSRNANLERLQKSLGIMALTGNAPSHKFLQRDDGSDELDECARD